MADTKRINDVELLALSALVQTNAVLMAGENQGRANGGWAPAWTADCLPSDEEEVIRKELELRGILNPAQEK